VALHLPVLLEEAVGALCVRPGGAYVDATFGAGGHSRAIAALGGEVIALDADPSAHLEAGDAPGIRLVHANFTDLARVLDECGTPEVDGVLFDFGVSSMQFDLPERGFSLRADGPLDMRMNTATGSSAADLLASASERELADLIYTSGEEPAARRIARAIVRAREAGRLPQRTLDFAYLVAGAVHARGYWRIHPATRTFQALRIAVNDELHALEAGLESAIVRTRPGGRIVTISFHSLEDRIVKQAFRQDSRVTAVTRKPIVPGEAELARNPRARSAKLRVAQRAYQEGTV
jgi:16S rRNA (cytosine1402-N4)-methyltransferase